MTFSFLVKLLFIISYTTAQSSKNISIIRTRVIFKTRMILLVAAVLLLVIATMIKVRFT